MGSLTELWRPLNGTLHNEASGSVALNQASMIEDIATTFGATSGRHWETPMAEKIDPSYIDEEGDLDGCFRRQRRWL